MDLTIVLFRERLESSEIVLNQEIQDQKKDSLLGNMIAIKGGESLLY